MSVGKGVGVGGSVGKGSGSMLHNSGTASVRALAVTAAIHTSLRKRFPMAIACP